MLRPNGRGFDLSQKEPAPKRPKPMSVGKIERIMAGKYTDAEYEALKDWLGEKATCNCIWRIPIGEHGQLTVKGNPYFPHQYDCDAVTEQ